MDILKVMQTYLYLELIKMSQQEYYENLNLGINYLCDKCDVVKLSEKEFIENQKSGKTYCDSCYNWFVLKHGLCDNCGNIKTLRQEYNAVSIKCECGSVIKFD